VKRSIQLSLLDGGWEVYGEEVVEVGEAGAWGGGGVGGWGGGGLLGAEAVDSEKDMAVECASGAVECGVEWGVGVRRGQWLVALCLVRTARWWLAAQTQPQKKTQRRKLLAPLRMARRVTLFRILFTDFDCIAWSH
jgi:hypothetical protein